MIKRFQRTEYTRHYGEDCGNPNCNSDHIYSERRPDGILFRCHTEDCMIFLPSGTCECNIEQPRVIRRILLEGVTWGS